MINLYKLTFGFLCSICMSMFVACSTQDDILEDITKEEYANQPHTCALVLNVTKSGFNDESKSRGTSGWVNGDKIYLTFNVGSGITYGDAIFDNGSWTVNYYGSLTEGALTKCTAVYFDNPEFESSSVVRITENTGIYEDTNGSYVYSGGTLSVTADLKPKTGRIRFAGTNDDVITIYGISHYTSFDCSTGKFTSSTGALKKTIATGYTPYVYGFFPDSTQQRLNVITKTSGYNRLLSASIYKAGESGYMTIPSDSSHNGWLNSVILKVNGVEFTMIPVVSPSGPYLLAETETTTELYNAVTGASASTSQLPKSNLCWDQWLLFVSKISSITELHFRMPTESEWIFAAKGGQKSQNYTYSGSNIFSHVGWFKGNADGSVHAVKQLQPNELGFYDMSGNLSEATSTYYNYSYYYLFYGGSYINDESSCTVFTNDTYHREDPYSTTGLRLALSNQ